MAVIIHPKRYRIKFLSSPHSEGEDTEMTIISVRLPKRYIEALDLLVQEGIFITRSEAIRAAIRKLLLQYVSQ